MRLPGAARLVVGLQHKRGAERYLRDVRERLARFGRSLHRDKTRLVEFGRFALLNRRQRGMGKPEPFGLSGLHALLQDNPERTLSAWSQTRRQTGQQDPGTHRRGAPQALAPRHLGSWKVARAGLQWLAQLLCRPGVGLVHPCVPPKTATPVDAGATPPVPASPLQLEAFGTHDPATLAARCHPPPLAGPAVCRQSPEVGAGWFNDHVRICAGGGGQQCAFLPRSYPASLHELSA